MQILTYRDAGYPAVAVETVEEERLTAALVSALPPETRVLRVSGIGGLTDARTGATIDPRATYPAAFAAAAAKENCVLITLDAQHVLRNAGIYRALRDQLPLLKARGSLILLLAPAWSLPAELEHEIPVLRWALPTREELRAALHVCADGSGVVCDTTIESAILDAAAGLTLSEAESVMALSIAQTGRFDRGLVEEQKLRLLRQVAGLEVAPAASPQDIGGLGNLQGYLSEEVLPAKDDPQLRVRGILLVGVPGTGKSLAARAAGAVLEWPVVRMDLSAMKGSLVGQSESNLRNALRVVEAIAPCVLWLDEVEKAVGGYQSSAATDSGVTLGMVGALLTWLQEHTSPIIVIATCNDYAKLPPELTRAGRFDERFFVDLPSAQERVEIATVHLRRYGCEIDGHAAAIASLSDGWTGAEIEQLVRSAARRTQRAISRDALTACARDIKPISRVRAQEIEALRAWARESLRLANTPEAEPSGPARRVRGGAR